MNAKEIIFAGGRKTHPKPIENYADPCYSYYVYLWARDKSALLQILTAQTYKIFKIGVDKGDEPADNGLPTYLPTYLPTAQSIVLPRLFVNPFLPNFIGDHETTIFYGTGGLCL